LILAARLQNRQSLSRVFDVAKVHYDLPMEIHEATYDRRLTASCAYWHDATTLDGTGKKARPHLPEDRASATPFCAGYRLRLGAVRRLCAENMVFDAPA